jgi:DNA polymerase-3 subunit delta
MASRSEELKPVYLILSEQALLVDEALARLRRRVGEHADLDFNSQTFSGDSAEAESIVAACNTMPFASDLRLVVVRDIGKMSKAGMDVLATYVADPSPTTVLALAGDKLAKNLKLYKAVERVGDVVDRKMGKADFPAVVRRMFEQAGKSITLDGAEELVSAVGYDLRRLSAEVDKAVAFVGDRTEVTREDVADVTTTTAPTSVWDYTEALGDRDCRRALARLNDLLGEGESIFGLHAMGLRALRELLAVRAMLDRGHATPSQVARELGRQEWQMKRAVRQARNFRSEELVGLLIAAAEAEAQMKTSRDSRLVLERWIVKVCV